MTDEWPKPLQPAEGPYPAQKIIGAAEGMGAYGDATRRLVDRGLLQPDLITGQTLWLIARQPRTPRPDDADRVGGAEASGVAGAVWVREQFTIHRPVRSSDPFTVTGSTTGSYIRKGRRYSTTQSESHTAAGELFATNLTTGLLSYQADPDLADASVGLALDETPAPTADHLAALANPHLPRLSELQVGHLIGGEEVLVSLEMMAARDTDNPDNPIHSDPAEAAKAGLSRPIAGGSHVLSFLMEALMAEFGEDALLYGTHFDVRWKAPTEDGVTILPSAMITDTSNEAITIGMTVDIVEGPTAMVGTITIPLPRHTPHGAADSVTA